MGPELLEIEPSELLFTFEVKKQSSCSVKLINRSTQYVAFKVKTTNPKKYCVRPNIGVVQPISTCDFTVTMQAQRVAPPDMQCKDKFLIQSINVPYGTIAEDVTSTMFSKDDSKYIEESKLKVVLVSPPQFTALPPTNGALKQESEASDYSDQWVNGIESPPLHKVAKDVEFKPAKDVEKLKPAKDVEKKLKPVKDAEELRPATYTEELKPAKQVGELKPARYAEELKPAQDAEEFRPTKDVDLKIAEELKPAEDVKDLKQVKGVDLKLSKDVEELRLVKDLSDFKLVKHAVQLKLTKDADQLKLTKDAEELKLAQNVELKLAQNVEELKLAKDVELKLVQDVEELKSKLKVLGSKLHEAEVTITKLREERDTSIEDKRTFPQQMTSLRRRNGERRAQVGFPFLFVVTVALISLVLGYLLRGR